MAIGGQEVAVTGLRFWVLGPVGVTGPSGPIALGGPRQRAVLALLLAHPGQVVGVGDLLDGLWAEDAPRSAERTLHAYISRLRAVLGTSLDPVLTRSGNGYTASVSAEALDAMAFEGELAGARRQLAAGDIDGGSLRLRSALGLWRGPAFADLTDFPGVQSAAQRLERLRSDAVADWVNADLSLGRHETLVPALRNLVADAPLDERLWGALALAYYRQGLQAEALGALSQARHVLRDELGIDPGSALRDLQAAILEGDPRLDLPTGPALGRDHPGLEGRDDALATLREGWITASHGRGGVRVVTGAAGSGRSRLLAAFAAEARAGGGQVVGIEDLAGPDDLARTVDASPGTTVLVVIDDVEDAGPETWRDLRALAAVAGSRPALILLGVCDERLSPELAAVLGELDPVGEFTVSLPPLGAEQVTRIAASYVGPELALEAAIAVSDDARGLPGRIHSRLEEWARSRLAAGIASSARSAAQDFRDAQRHEARLAEELLGLSAIETAAVAAKAAASPAQLPCPYPGLASYDAADAAYFAGREELVAAVVARLAAAGRVVVVGASGAGKSSLLRAGVVPALASGALPGSGGWQVAVVTPRSGMPEMLTAGRAPDADTDGRLLVVDQLEELLTMRPSDRTRFTAALQSFTRDGGRLLLGVRGDQYAALASDPGLAEALSSAPLTVTSMTEAQIMRAVEVPVRRAGRSCAPGLAALVAADLLGEPGGLPLLSIAMRRLWELSSTHVLSADAYVAAGGVQDAVARLAEESYARLSGDEQSAARALLLRMAQPAGAAEFVRTYLPLESVASSGPAQKVLRQFAGDRLVSVDTGGVTVAHEALFTQWPRLAQWLEEDREAVAARSRLSVRARSWADAGRQESDLLRGGQLVAARELATEHPELLSEDEATFVRESAAAAADREVALERAAHTARKSNRRLRALLSATVVAMLVATAAAGWAAHLRRQSQHSASVATARAIGAQAVTTGRLDLALLLAAQASVMDPGQQTRADLIASMTRAPTATHIFVGTGERLLRLAVGGTSPRVVLLDRASVATVFDLATHRRATSRALRALNTAGTTAAAFSSDGTVLALGAASASNPQRGTVAFLDPNSLDTVRPPMQTSAPVTALAYGVRTLAVMTADGVVTVVDRRTLHPVGHPIHAPGPAVDVAFGGHGRWLVTAAPLRLWDLRTGRQVPVPDAPAGAISPAGTTLAVVDPSTPGLIRLLDRGSGRELKTLVGSPAPVQRVAFSPDGRRLVATAEDGTASLWDVASGRRLLTLSGHDGRVSDAAFSPDGRTLVTAGLDGRAISWDLAGAVGPGGPTPTLAGIAPDVLAQSYVALSVVADRILVGEPDGTVVIARATDGAELASFAHVQRGGVNDAQLSRDGSLGATAGSDGTIRLWDMRRARPAAPKPVLRPPALPASVAVSPDDRTIAWGDLTGTVRAASVADGHVLWTRKLTSAQPDGRGAVFVVSYSADGATVGASVSHVATELLPASGVGAVRMLHAGDDNTTAYAYSSDGRSLVTGDSDGSAHLWNLATGVGKDLGTGGAPASSGIIYGAAFDPGGDTVATWAFDGSVRLWDVASASPVGPSLTQAGSGVAVAAGWDGEDRLVAVQSDGMVRRFDVSQASLVRRACAIVGRPLTTEERAKYLPGYSGPLACAGARLPAAPLR